MSEEKGAGTMGGGVNSISQPSALPALISTRRERKREREEERKRKRESKERGRNTERKSEREINNDNKSTIHPMSAGIRRKKNPE